MNVGDEWKDPNFESIDYYVKFEATLATPPTSRINLFQIATDNEKEAIRGTDDYMFYFQIWKKADEFISWREWSYFMVYYPDDYSKFDTIAVTSPTDMKRQDVFIDKYTATKWHSEEYRIGNKYVTEGDWDWEMNQLGNTFMIDYVQSYKFYNSKGG